MNCITLVLLLKKKKKCITYFKKFCIINRSKASKKNKTVKSGKVSKKNKTVKSGKASKKDFKMYDKDPMMCKEYKILGICGYGNSCKFIHHRKIVPYYNTKY